MGDMRITVNTNGPYLVEGGVPLVRLEIVTNDAGESVGWREIEHLDAGETYMLCRCGHSSTKPFCDFSHLAEEFVGTETADHEPYFAISSCMEGPGLKLRDAERLCAEARFCDRAGGLWNLINRCDNPEARALVEEEASLCPSGRYVICDSETDEPLEPVFGPSIALVEDPALGVSGPVFVRGGIPIVGADGEPYEVRNRVTLCRCGSSANKPFCDGSHIGVGFVDEGARG